ncbi:MAG: tol-pal system protein YbgF [Alphaproteobacteria bacterium]|nr:tol-pal system protein YbgF [Alphaproteobacteria bacterium]
MLNVSHGGPSNEQTMILSQLRIFLVAGLAVPGLAGGTAGIAQAQAQVQAQAQAQLFDRPRGELPRGEPQGGASGAAQAVRIDRLENHIRQLTGQIEQLQFEVRRLQDQLRKFQGDVDFRFQERGQERGGGARPAPARRGEAVPPVPRNQQSQGEEPPPEETDQAEAPPDTASPQTAEVEPQPRRGQRRGDAFDPSAQPEAPGAPRQLGSTAPSRPLERQPGGRALPGGPLGNDQPGTDRDADDPNAPVDLRRPGPVASVRPPLAEGGGAQAPAPSTPRQQFDLAVAAMKERRYEDAGRDFENFIATHPKSGLAPEATFQLGLSFERRNRHREAAEQYLKVATDYSKARRAAESMWRLGMTLERLGAKEQACATYQEASRKYPLAPNYVRTGLERQIARASC